MMVMMKYYDYDYDLLVDNSNGLDFEPVVVVAVTVVDVVWVHEVGMVPLPLVPTITIEGGGGVVVVAITEPS
jgi:hypothetical protein